MTNTTLNATSLSVEHRAKWERMKDMPVTVLQIGEGNFLRGFADWMIQTCVDKGLYHGSVAVMQPRPSGAPKIERLKTQDGLFTLVTRGLDQTGVVDQTEIISVFSQIFDPYSEWETFLEIAVSPDLQCVISNTTEAGLVYKEEPLQAPIQSFPGKITVLLYERFKAFAGAEDKGLIFLPCELVEQNGDVLRDCVLRHARDWGFPETFCDWVRHHNRFCNSLVDRIVSGFPPVEQAEAWMREWEYRDQLIVAAEPYHLWAIEADPSMEQILPFQQAGLNVHWVDDLTPFQQRKVRILNGAHTLMAPLGILHGIESVRQMMEHEKLGVFVRETIKEEILPTLPYPEEEITEYAERVIERYMNPFNHHRLADIAMNSISKFRTRLLPTLKHYLDSGDSLPSRIVYGFAALLRYYKVQKSDDGYTGRTFSGKDYTVRDDAQVLEEFECLWSQASETSPSSEGVVSRLLASEKLWDQNLSAFPNLVKQVAVYLAEMEGQHE